MERCFKNDDGNIVIWQKPNLPIIIWLVSSLLVQLTHGRLEQLFNLTSYGALFTWAYLEIFQGVNWFRRTLGFVILTATIYSRIY
jgi:hypothetical protein